MKVVSGWRENTEYRLPWPHRQLVLGMAEVGHKYAVLSSYKGDFISFTVSLWSVGNGAPGCVVHNFSDVKNALV